MPTGYIDPNGVWQYGEDDVVSPWSDYMNLGQASVSAALATKQYTVVDDAAARDALFPAPATEPDRLTLQGRGITVLRRDRAGTEERYFATYNSVSNPFGRAVPGWYPSGLLFAEYTTPTLAAASGVVTTSGTPVLAAARSSARATDLFTPAAGGITLRNPGIYRADAGVTFASAVSGRSFAELTVGGTTVKRQSIAGAGESDGGVDAEILTTAANQALAIRAFHTSGAPVNFTSIIRLEYVGPLA